MTNTTYTLITGASRGIGKELAVEAAKDGRHLILVAQQQQPLEAVAQLLTAQYGATVQTLVQDLRKPGAALAMYQEVSSRGLGIDTLINNAGLGTMVRFKQVISSGSMTCSP